MNLDDITLFIQVVEQGSFTKAADLNDLPKSTISRRIRNLEDSLQCRLLERTTRKITLTDIGQAFLQRAYELTTHIEETQRQISHSQDDYAGNLTLYGAEYLFRMGLDHINHFLQHYDNLSISIHTSSLPLNRMSECRFDLMLSIGELPDSSFVAVPLAELHYDLFISPKYLNLIGNDVTEEDVLTKHNIAIQELANNTQCWPHDKLPLKRSPRFVVESPDLLAGYVEEGMAIGCLPIALAKNEVGEGRLVNMFKSKYRFPMTVYAIYHSRRYVPAKVKLLIEELKDKMQDAIN